jgi:hypothetical protein
VVDSAVHILTAAGSSSSVMQNYNKNPDYNGVNKIKGIGVPVLS